MWVKSGFSATFWSSKRDVTWPLEAPAKEEAIEFIVTLDQTQQVRWVALRLLKFSAWIRFDYIWKVMYVLFWRNTEEINMFFCNMKKHVLYQLSVCIQVIHHYRFFCPAKTQVFIHRTHSLLVPFGWHRQNWHRSSRYSPELAFLVSKNIGSDGSEIQPVMENLPFCVWVRWKNLNISLKWRGFFTL